jgi:hypothetical protein
MVLDEAFHLLDDEQVLLNGGRLDIVVYEI